MRSKNVLKAVPVQQLEAAIEFQLQNLGLTWDGLGLSYSEFLSFCFNGNLAQFYKGLGWKTLQQEAAKINADKVINFVPPLWSKQGKDISKCERMAVSIEQQYQYNQQMRKQLGLEKKVQQ